MTDSEAAPGSRPRGGGTRKRSRRPAKRAQGRVTSCDRVQVLVEARRLLGQCDDAVLRTRRLLDAAGDGGNSEVWYREARRRAELLETYSRELAEVLEAVEGEARVEDYGLPVRSPLEKLPSAGQGEPGARFSSAVRGDLWGIVPELKITGPQTPWLGRPPPARR